MANDVTSAVATATDKVAEVADKAAIAVDKTAETVTSLTPPDITQQLDAAKQFLDKDNLIGLINAAIPYVTNFILALIIFFIGKYIANVIENLVTRLVGRSSKDDILSSFVGSIVKFAVLLFVAIAALSQLGINTSSLVALVGAAGLAVGLSLQNSLQNFAAGVMILIFKPFKKDQTIEAAGVSGVVQRMGILMLEMRTPDNRQILIPNGKVMSDNIINYDNNPTRRVDLVLDISYNADIKTAKRIIQECFDEDPRILKTPAPTIVVGNWAASSIQIWARPWTKTADAWPVRWDLLEKIKYAFDENGIEIPFNQMDIRICNPEGATVPDELTVGSNAEKSKS